MSNYLITYDLRAPGRSYEKLYGLLRDTWRAQPLAESVWVAELRGPAPLVRDAIQYHCDQNDRIVVIELSHGAEWATTQAVPAGVTWLSRHISTATVPA